MCHMGGLRWTMVFICTLLGAGSGRTGHCVGLDVSCCIEISHDRKRTQFWHSRELNFISRHLEEGRCKD